jgi:hypothetical protein
MALPKLETPRYELVIPSTNKTVAFRPYLVKEEKVLLMALESDNPKQIFAAMQDVISACTFGAVSVDSLTSFDIEYIFLQLRIKSVGETVTVSLKCEKDDAYTQVEVNLNDVKLNGSSDFKPTLDIKLNDTVGVVLKPIRAQDLIPLEGNQKKVDLITDLVIATISHIYDESKIYRTEDVSKDELKQFVDSLSRQQVEKIQNYIASFPRLELDVTFTCFKCGHINTVKLSGIQSFFV